MSRQRPAPWWPEEGFRVDEALIKTIGLTDHALIQFVDRAQPWADSPREDSIKSDPRAKEQVQQTLRRLMQAEGRATYKRPHWSQSKRQADWYVQVGEFLLLILEWDPKRENWGCWTIVNGPEWNTWKVAFDRGWTKVPPPAAKSPREKQPRARTPQRPRARQPERARTRGRPRSRPRRRPTPVAPGPPASTTPASSGRSLAATGGLGALALVVLCLVVWLLLTLMNDRREDRARDALAIGALQQTRDLGRLDLSESETARILAKTDEVEVRLANEGDGLRSDLACGEREAWRLTDHDTIDVCVLVDPDSGRLLGSFERVRSKPRLVAAKCRGQAVTEQVRCRGR